MIYNFDEQIIRRGSCSYKWDSSEKENVLPLWVADMDFKAAPAILEALRQRMEHGIFGYTRVPDSYYQSVTNWFARRHGWQINREWIIYTSGVIPAISAVIKALTSPGDKVLIQTPVYNCFFSSIRNNGCETVTNPLKYQDSTYTVDFEDLERKLADPLVRIMLLCNPHNPAGRVWTREELTRIGELCIRHQVVIVSDEIHCELVFPGHKYTPFASISDEFRHHAVSFVSPSKAFNIAGLQIADIVCENEEMRKKIDRAINDNEVCDVNPFGVVATQAAYDKGEEWLTQLLEYIYGNYRYMQAFCQEHLPEFSLTRLEGTYLAWMDCRALHIPSEELEQQLIDKAGLWLNSGTMYGTEGEGFMRWNIACPRANVEEGLKRFRDFVKMHSAC